LRLLAGGEPLLFSNINEIIEQIKNKKIDVVLTTNGSLIKTKIIKNMILFKLDKIRISLHAATSKTYIKTHGVDHFNLVIKNINEVILKRKDRFFPKIILYFVIQKDNYHEINKLVRLAIQLGVDEIEFGVLIDFKTKISLELNSSQYKKIIRTLEKINNNNNVVIKNNIKYVLPGLKEKCSCKKDNNLYDEKKYCPIITNTVEMSATGEIYPCCFSINSPPKVFIQKNSFILINAWKKYSQFRKKILKGQFYTFCNELCTMRISKLVS